MTPAHDPLRQPTNELQRCAARVADIEDINRRRTTPGTSLSASEFLAYYAWREGLMALAKDATDPECLTDISERIRRHATINAARRLSTVYGIPAEQVTTLLLLTMNGV